MTQQTLSFENAINLIKQLSLFDQIQVLEWIIVQVKQKLAFQKTGNNISIQESFQPDDELEKVVAEIQATPSDPANITLASGLLAEHLRNPLFDAKEQLSISSFLNKWRGSLKGLDPDELKYQYLWEKYG